MFALLYVMYADEMTNNTKSAEPLINNGISDVIWLYVIHNEDEMILITENTNENGFVDFLVYNKYININRPDIEMTMAEYAVTSWLDIPVIIAMWIMSMCVKKLKCGGEIEKRQPCSLLSLALSLVAPLGLSLARFFSRLSSGRM